MLQKIKREGVSLRTVHSVLIVLAVVVSGLLIFATYHSSTFLHLSEATDEYITLQKAAYELMDASDYLTEEVRLFTRTGDPAYMNNYFREANETRRRDRALQIVSEAPNSDAAFQQLRLAMDESVNLMDREYYAMKLVVEARGITECPDEIRGVVLDPSDTALSPEEKM